MSGDFPRSQRGETPNKNSKKSEDKSKFLQALRFLLRNKSSLCPRGSDDAQMLLYQNFNQSEYAISNQSICTVQQTGTKDYIPNLCRNYEIEYGLRSADYGEALGSVTFGFESSCYSSTAAFDLVHSLRIQSVSRRATKRFTRVNLFVARRETLCIRRLPC